MGDGILLRQSIWEAKLSKRLLREDFLHNPEQTHSFIVELARPRTDRVCSIVEANQGKIRNELSLIPSLVIDLPYASLRELSFCRHVRKVWHDARVVSLLNDAVPAVGGNEIHKMGFTGQGVTVAILDTGIHPHRDLVLGRNRIVAWNDLVNHRATPYDDQGHGTHVAGIIAGNGFTSRGRFQGMAPEANLVGVKVLDDQGGGAISTVIAGIEWCLQNQETLNIRVMNLSLGSSTQDSYRVDPLCRATSRAWQKGIIVCAAAGNDGPGDRTIDSPGNNPTIITVGNLDNQNTISAEDDRLHQSSSRGPTVDRIVKPDLLAPGTDITSIWINGSYKSLTGTSMATPMVAGAATLILQKWPTATPVQVKRALMKNAKNMGLSPNFQGAGALNLARVFAPAATARPRQRLFAAATPERSLMMTRLQSAGAPNVLLCHLMKLFLDSRGVETGMLTQKRDQLLQQGLVKFFFE